MSFEKALAKRLLMAGPIAGKVASRVDWMRRPQGAALPAITLQIITDTRDQHYGGFHPSVTRVQCDVWTDDFLASTELRDLIVPVLVPAAKVDGIRFQRGQGVTIRPATDADADGTPLYRQIIDITFTHNG